MSSLKGSSAIFVDGENVSPSYSAKIIECAASLGPISIQRVYGNAALIPQWTNTPGFRTIHSDSGKNASDILLTIDAMEIALVRTPSQMVIASSDRDFTHLAMRLREHGLNVLGIGASKAPKAFRAACSTFMVLEPDQPPCQDSAQKGSASKLDCDIRSVIANAGQQGRGMKISELSLAMRKHHGISISELPEKKWRTYLSSRGSLYEIDPKGPEAYVRFKRDGFPG